MSIVMNLLYSLEEITNELKKNGKYESASFFAIRHDKIKNYGEEKTQEIIKELSACRAMSQYANFSLNEEMLLDAVVNNAVALKK